MGIGQENRYVTLHLLHYTHGIVHTSRSHMCEPKLQRYVHN